MKIIKRSGQEENFDISKIERAVKKANDSVQGSSRISEEDFELIVEDVYENIKDFKTVSVETIQDKVETSIAKFGYFEVSKSYILFRNKKANNKKFTPAEEKIISITNGVNEDVIQDNSNKNPVLLSTQRDYISGTMCKSIAEKILPKEIVEAHKNGEIHFIKKFLKNK
jgi:ribonucleoside-triphosphate reductase